MLRRYIDIIVAYIHSAFVHQVRDTLVYPIYTNEGLTYIPICPLRGDRRIRLVHPITQCCVQMEEHSPVVAATKYRVGFLREIKLDIVDFYGKDKTIIV